MAFENLRELGLNVNVAAKNAETLDRVAAGVKRLTDAEIAYQRAAGNRQASANIAAAAAKDFENRLAVSRRYQASAERDRRAESAAVQRQNAADEREQARAIAARRRTLDQEATLREQAAARRQRQDQKDQRDAQRAADALQSQFQTQAKNAQALDRAEQQRLATAAAARDRDARSLVADLQRRGRETEAERQRQSRAQDQDEAALERRVAAAATARQRDAGSLVADLQRRGREAEIERQRQTRAQAQDEAALAANTSAAAVARQREMRTLVADLTTRGRQEQAARQQQARAQARDENDLAREQTQAVRQRTQQMQQLVADLNARGRAEQRQRAEEQGQPGVLGSVFGFLGEAAQTMTTIIKLTLIWAYALRQIGGIVRSTIVDPLVAVTREVLGDTDQFRRLLTTISGVTGSISSARVLQGQTLTAASGLPITGLDALEVVRKLATIPTTARSVQDPNGRPDRLRDLLGTVTGLSVINPTQGSEGAIFAIREALAGQFRSLRNRFDVNPDTIAALLPAPGGRAGQAKLSDLKADPQLVLKALQEFVRVFVGPRAIDELQNLLSTQGQRLRGVLQEFFALIGDQGFYDKVVGVVRRFTDRFQAAVRRGPNGEPPALEGVAGLISASLSRLADRLLEALSNAISGATGKNVDLQKLLEDGDLQRLGVVVADVIDTLVTFAGALALVASDLLAFAAKVARSQGAVIGPLSPADIRDELNALSIQRETVQGRRDRAAAAPNLRHYFGGGEPGAGAAAAGAALVLSREDQATLATAEFSAELERLDTRQKYLEDRLRVLGGFRRPDRNDPFAAERRSVNAALDPVTESTKALAVAQNAVSTVLQNIPADKEQSLAEEAKKVTDLLGHAFDPSQPGSLAFAVTAARAVAENLDKAFNDPEYVSHLVDLRAEADAAGDLGLVHSIDGLLGGIKDIRKAVDATIKGMAGDIREAQRQMLQAFAAKSGQLPPAALVRESSSFIDSIIAANRGGNFATLQNRLPRSLQSETFRVQNLVPPGAAALGLNPSFAPGPEDAKDIVSQIEAIGRGLRELDAPSGQILRTLNQDLEAFDRIYQKQREAPNLTQNQIEDITKARDYIANARKKISEEYDEIKKVTASFAQEISGSFKTAFVDVLVDVFSNGARDIKKIMLDLGKAIEKAIAEYAVELFVIRGLVNPFLNSSFNLTGSNRLPTLGQESPPTPPSGGAGVLAGNAMGGVHRGSLRPVPAAMGILTRPGQTFSTVEDGNPEAVVPIRGGGIPVKISGGSGSRGGGQPLHLTIVQTMDPLDVVRAGVARDPNTIIVPVAADIAGGGRVRRLIHTLRN